MIFSNNACMNILHITKVIIIILQGRNDWFGGFRNLLRRYLRTFEGMEYSFEGSATTKIWILTGSRTFLEWNHWIITNLNAYTRTGSFYCWAIFRHRENTPRVASRARMGGFAIAANPKRALPSTRGSMRTRSCGFPTWSPSRTRRTERGVSPHWRVIHALTKVFISYLNIFNISILLY